MIEPCIPGKLVRAQQAIEAVFAPGCRPSLRWWRERTRARAVPSVTIGRLVYYDIDTVRAALMAKSQTQGRKSGTTP